MKIPVTRLDSDLELPKSARAGDAGVDLVARESGRIEPGGRAAVATGVAVAIPEGHVGLVTARSGLALRAGISVVNGPGIIDAGYRGEIKAILGNTGAEPFVYQRGDRIAQLVVVAHEIVEFFEVDQLPESERGPGGFGSTGQ